MLDVNADTILAAVKSSMPNGITQKGILAFFAEDHDLSIEEIGTLDRNTSGLLSDLAKNGHLDDSRREGQTQKRIYKIPQTKLPVRAKRTEVLEAEIFRLKEQVQSLKDARDAVCEMRDRWKEKYEELANRLTPIAT